jgi:hypothetical protein
MSDKTIIGWKLYYGDGLVLSSKQSTWADAPSDNVQVLIVYFAETYKIHRDGEWQEENYRDMYFGYDYFWQYGNGQTAQVLDGAEVKLGKELPQDEWRAIYNQAWQDMKI